ncbi:hypothetical protein GCM10008939_33610 [Deinococcus aquiradiocola]|uniref:Uncharacterized protein n=1 Tax=Deinococcus aquiradiocola TaxID=393059 RepID=A0A917PPC8_9DEIO|nr:hypothetical protein GCM10008939_33610 [Deinococcus aquiradiocola]
MQGVGQDGEVHAVEVDVIGGEGRVAGQRGEQGCTTFVLWVLVKEGRPCGSGVTAVHASRYQRGTAA